MKWVRELLKRIVLISMVWRCPRRWCSHEILIRITRVWLYVCRYTRRWYIRGGIGRVWLCVCWCARRWYSHEMLIRGRISRAWLCACWCAWRWCRNCGAEIGLSEQMWPKWNIGNRKMDICIRRTVLHYLGQDMPPGHWSWALLSLGRSCARQIIATNENAISARDHL